ncbi:LAQU0S04e01750g1_1 [Lachancea quebecensis]|uniref:LAQU0S04e01750g1_1 n=1 Tax=Lachancea quebecensis TaxID=1654605 RepID=A0A0P1KSB1_9SACH|nr:LAQU0S04e01750g1_1 [Lachancea quebecensis]
MSLRYQKFLLFGDSITEFAFNTRMSEGKGDQFSLGAALVNAYTRKLDIIQRGFSGYNSRWALEVLPHILENEPTDDIVLSTIFFGSNDAVHGGSQKVELPEFTQNITELVRMLKNKGIQPILVGPALHDADKWESVRPDDVATGAVRSNENNKRYSDALQEVARAEEVAFVNLIEAFSNKGGSGWRSLLNDGLHFSGEGYEIFYDELLKTIRATHPEWAPENVAYKYPNWRQVESDGSNLR